MCAFTAATFAAEWLAHPEWWFAGVEHDAVICERYAGLLDLDLDGEWEKEPLPWILLWDQLPRHVFRKDAGAAHVITWFLEKACAVVAKAGENAWEGLDDDAFMFFWLPYRHSQEALRLLKAMEATWARVVTAGGCSPRLKKVIKAMYTRAALPEAPELLRLYRGGEGFRKAAWVDVLDTQCFGPRGESKKKFGEWDAVGHGGSVLVSLSGGVDSMVLLARLREERPGVRVAAVHINYDNRASCAREEAMLVAWCACLGVPLYVRRIVEIHRDPCRAAELRGLYEAYTKKVRFAAYRNAWKDFVGEGAGIPQVLMGHNADDGVENILQNMTHHSKYANLLGMSVAAELDGVCLIRPLLRVAKRDIFAWALARDIPFLEDSTVSWSVRGQLRDRVIPAIAAFNPRTVDGLVAAADAMTELYGVMVATVDEWVSGLHSGGGKDLRRAGALPMSAMFWKEFFLRAFGICVSNRSIQNVLERLRRVNVMGRRYRVVVKKGWIMDVFREKDGWTRLCFSSKPCAAPSSAEAKCTPACV